MKNIRQRNKSVINAPLKSLPLLSVVSRLRIKSIVSDSMFSISPGVISLRNSRFSRHWKRLLFLSFGRTTGLRNRCVIINRFINQLLLMNKNHGTELTVKWLKCSYVALQKALAGDKLTSLRLLEPTLPLPRLVNGFPAIIGSKDRAAIKAGTKSVIIFWSSLFSLYRVLKTPYKLKLSTITDPFSGSLDGLKEMLSNQRNFFEVLPHYNKWVEGSIWPEQILFSTKASPSNSPAFWGILYECKSLYDNPDRLKLIERYLSFILTKTEQSIMSRIEQGNELASLASTLDLHLQSKESAVDTWGQLSFKEEAAGKLRVFAILDTLSQSILKPLHDQLFSLLRLIPNDGTFDQDESVKRSQAKAIKFGCAFSFDLTAATDRLPAQLSAKVLSHFYGIGFSQAWLDLLTDREFSMGDKQALKYLGSNGSPRLRYAVGQPMGAYSSWAMLALTHHWILQFASASLGLQGWEERYEILGDDLVIFDPLLAKKYLQICQILGVEINLTKSISSPSRPIFEFAKRTCWGDKDLSPISFKTLLATSLADLTGNYLSWSSRGLINKAGVLHAAISKFGEPKLNINLGLPMLAILGALVGKQVPHRWLVEALIDPKVRPFRFETAKFNVPISALSRLLISCSRSITSGWPLDQRFYPFHERMKRVFPAEAILFDINNQQIDDLSIQINRLAKDWNALIFNLARSQFVSKAPQVMSPAQIAFIQSVGTLFTDNIINNRKGWDLRSFVGAYSADVGLYAQDPMVTFPYEDYMTRVLALSAWVRVAPPSRSSRTTETAKVLVDITKAIKGQRFFIQRGVN